MQLPTPGGTSRAAVLPFSALEENVPKMKAWLLRHFASSTFNQCPHQVLPVMTGPLLEVHLNPNATPRYVSTPSMVPLHWQEKVKTDMTAPGTAADA